MGERERRRESDSGGRVSESVMRKAFQAAEFLMSGVEGA